MLNITKDVNTVAGAVHEALGNRVRFIVAIAGPPGSGKSTLAAEVVRRLTDQRVSAMVVPMDGFHLDNAILEARGLLARKGAPESFDASGFCHLVQRLATGDEVIIPAFDRARDIAIAGANVVPADCRVVVVEGNYLLLDEAPWRDLRRHWDLAVRLDVPMADLRARLIQRWLTHGLSRTAATRRAESNDIVNAQRVVDKVLPADVVITGHQDR